MTNHQNPKRIAETQKDKTVFFHRVIWIVNKLRPLIREDGLRLLKAHAMLLLIRRSHPLVPLKVKIAHAHTSTTV